MKKGETNVKIQAAFFLLLLEGCAANLGAPSTPSSTTNTTLTAQNTLADSYIGTFIDFNYSNYYSLTSPNPATSCAGDANAFYDPIALSSSLPVKYPLSVVDSTTTLRPSFISNLSVDLTDSNVPISSNKALSCSLGSGISSPPVSNCATFDYGSIDGVPSNLGGTLLMIGGLTTTNYTGIGNQTQSNTVSCGYTSSSSGYNNQCSAGMYSLGVDVLPASAASATSTLTPGLTSASGPISMWTNLSSSSTYTGPLANAGASMSYDTNAKKLLLFGGATVTTGPGSTALDVPSSNTWTYDLKTQIWNQQSLNASVNSTMQFIEDLSISAANTIQIQKPEGGRAAFGYVALPGMAVSGLQTMSRDTTDRIITVGGLGSCYSGICTDVHSFNPTYGPEYYNLTAANVASSAATTTTSPTQWIDSYHTRSLTNSNPSTVFTPSPVPVPVPYATPSTSPTPPTSLYSFGAVGLTNNSAATTGQLGAGYVVTAGGFYDPITSPFGTNTPAGTCSTLDRCGKMQILLKWFNAAVSWSEANEKKAANFSSASNYLDLSGTEATPAEWSAIADGAYPATTPWYGGSTLLRGINLTGADTNEAVYFGGADCSTYLSGAYTCPNWSPSTGKYNVGRYWTFSSDPASQYYPSSGNFPLSTALVGSSPPNAGMAAARGTDASGNPIVVAWGGMSAPATIDNTRTIYFLFNNGGVPTWQTFMPSTGPYPTGMANGALVFSHVTGKFYLFGGYNSTKGGANGDTWELSINSTASSCGTAGGCTFTWRQLTTGTGLTCSPSCPTARRDHRMVEANYNNIDTTIEPTCTAMGKPCSFGIFMQGGTPDGVQFYSDRWMFDPTANYSSGHWQLMSDLPPRTLSSMSTVDYAIFGTSRTVRRAILFGGETGMQNPAKALSGSYFVPPTLGDTWMFDFDTGYWNRVSLYGKGYASAASASTLTTNQQREAFLDSSPPLSLSPPPTSGGVMVTRTFSRSTHSVSDTPNALAIPEVYFLGGRTKDGQYSTLDKVYKFCAGTTGEKPYPGAVGFGATSFIPLAVPTPDDATCDAYNSTTNSSSQGPSSDYVGRWIQKTPPTYGGLVPSNYSSYMGAAAYDSAHDLIVLYGGLMFSSTNTGITDSTNRTSTSSILEYTPASSSDVTTPSTPAQLNGTWTNISVCAENTQTPTPRYGHSLSFNPVTQSLIVTGGYNTSGALLTQSQSFNNGKRTQTLPEIWTAKRIDNAIPAGIANQNIPAITTGPFPCYYWSQVHVFGNSLNIASQVPPTTGLAYAATVFIPPAGYNTGYYSTFDASCANAGPYASSDPNVSKLNIGGAYIDLNRTKLGANENVILNLTLIPLGTQNRGPDQNYLTSTQSAVIQVHLVKTGESGDVIRQQPQPRALAYSSSSAFPQIIPDITVLAPPVGQIRQEQIFIPLSVDPTIDRIQIERYSGTAVLINATLYRTGQK